MGLAVLNIITGIFVNDAIEMATKDRDIVQQMEKDRSAELFGHAHKLFATIDVTGSGEITAEEFETAMERDHVRGFLAQMGLEVPDALKMFDALDSDQNGCIQVDEFVLGCMRMRGGHNVDLETLMRENRRFMRETVHQQQRLESRIQALMKSVNDALALPLLHSRGVWSGRRCTTSHTALRSRLRSGTQFKSEFESDAVHVDEERAGVEEADLASKGLEELSAAPWDNDGLMNAKSVSSAFDQGRRRRGAQLPSEVVPDVVLDDETCAFVEEEDSTSRVISKGLTGPVSDTSIRSRLRECAQVLEAAPDRTQLAVVGDAESTSEGKEHPPTAWDDDGSIVVKVGPVSQWRKRHVRRKRALGKELFM